MADWPVRMYFGKILLMVSSALLYLFFIVLNTLFKIPSVVDIILLAVNLSQSSKLKDFDSRKMSIICLGTIIASVIICIVAEFIMFLSTQGSSLG